MAENVPTKAQASDVYQALMAVWNKGGMTEAEFINAVAVNLGKFIGWMKGNPVDFLPMILAAGAAWREDSPEARP